MTHPPDTAYWKKVLLFTAVIVLVVSKSYFVLLVVTWGRLPEGFYAAYQYLGNWPSLLTHTFPYFEDRFGARGIDIVGGITDVKSAVVNVCGWLPIGALFGLALRSRREPRTGSDA